MTRVAKHATEFALLLMQRSHVYHVFLALQDKDRDAEIALCCSTTAARVIWPEQLHCWYCMTTGQIVIAPCNVMAAPRMALQVMPTQDSFEPELYLAIMHGDTSLSDLKTGRANLKFEVSERTGQLKDLVSQPAAMHLLGPQYHHISCDTHFCYVISNLLHCDSGLQSSWTGCSIKL